MAGQKRASSMNGAVAVRGKDDACCGVFFLKYVLFIFNVIFWLSGLVVLAVGLWTLLDKHHYASLLDSPTYSAVTWLLILTGIVIIGIGFFGCVAAAKEFRTCLKVYAILLIVVFLLEAICGILAYVYHAMIHAELQRSLHDTMMKGYRANSDTTKAIDDLQKHFKCCGAQSYVDWRESRWLPQIDTETQNLVPDSCCKTPSNGCAVRNHPSNINTDGCVSKLEFYIKDHLIIIGAVGLGLCCLQIFGIVFACCLAKELLNSRIQEENSLWQ